MYKRKKSPKRTIHFSSLCTLFGTYAVLCQIVFILLYVCTAPKSLSTDVLRHTVLPWLEYPLTSLALVFGGACLLDVAQRQ